MLRVTMVYFDYEVSSGEFDCDILGSFSKLTQEQQNLNPPKLHSHRHAIKKKTSLTLAQFWIISRGSVA